MRMDTFNKFAIFLKESSGLALVYDKNYLLESRLHPILRRWKIASLDELANEVSDRKNDRLRQEVMEAMTTNESSFFRDVKPFEQFRSFMLPRVLERNAATRQIRIWSAACSSGQEPYSLAMILRDEAARLAGWKVDIVATDISGDILAKARNGEYSLFEVQRGLPAPMLVRYFHKLDENRWRIDDSIRSMVAFQQRDLLGNLNDLGTFDIVFCRNVLIYFDQPTKTRVLDSIARLLAPDGVLLLGGAETVMGITDRFIGMPDQRGLYTLGTAPTVASIFGTAARA